MFTKKDSRWQGNIFCWLFLHCKALRRPLLQHSKLRLQYKVHLGPPDAAIWSNVGNVEATVQNYLTLRNSKTKHALLHVVSCHFVLCPYVCTVYVYVCMCVCVYVCASALWMWIALLELITVQNALLSSHQFTTVTTVPSSQLTISVFVFCVCLFHHCMPSGAFVSQLVQWHRFSAEFTFHQFPRRARGRTSLPPMINKPMILLLYSGWTIYPAPVW